MGQESPESEKVGLYQRMISLETPDSLAFIRQVFFASSSPVLREVQARYPAQVHKGSLSLPSPAEMTVEVDAHEACVGRFKRNKNDLGAIRVVE